MYMYVLLLLLVFYDFDVSVMSDLDLKLEIYSIFSSFFLFSYIFNPLPVKNERRFSLNEFRVFGWQLKHYYWSGVDGEL